MRFEHVLAPATFAFAIVLAAPANAKIVARDISIKMDKTDPSHASDMGKVHEARIYYDDSKVDPVTHRVAILHQQHTPMLIPFHPDAFEMPVSNAYLDLSARPYAYHMAASPGVRPLPNGRTMWKPYSILFDENSHRMTIRRQEDGGLELSGIYTVSDETLSGPEIDAVIYGSGPPKGMKWPPTGPGPGRPGGPGGMPLPASGTALPGDRQGAELIPGDATAVGGSARMMQAAFTQQTPPPGMGRAPLGGMPPGGLPAGMKMPPPPPLAVKRGKLVALGMDIIIDQVAPEDEGMYKVGAHDIARIVYNTADVDPVTKTVPILEESHRIMGHYHPNRETRASLLDLSSTPYRLTYISAPVHGRPLVIAFEGATQRMAVLARPDFHMLIAGRVNIDTTPVPYDPEHPEN